MNKFKVLKGPFIKDSNSTSKIMRDLLISLTPIILFSIYKNGYIPYSNDKVGLIGLIYPLIFILISTLTTYLTEFIIAKFILKKNNIKEYMNYSYAMIPGLFLGLIMPINTPLYLLVLGAIISTTIGKMIFGGFGNNIFNPALIGRLFIIFCFSSIISSNGGYLNNYELDAISHATPLTNYSTIESIGTYENLISPYGSLLNFFIGTIPGAIGETSSLLCLIGFIYLVLRKAIKWRIPVFYISTVFVLTFIIGIFNGVGIWYPLFQIFSGGLMFGAIFMATDPVTSPVTNYGQVLYGLFLGLLTVTFRYLTPYPEGVLTSILTMNMFGAILDDIGINFNKKKLLYLLVFISSSVLIIYNVNNKYQVSTEAKDPNFNILEVSENSNNIIYTVTQKGFGGNIKASITLENNQIINVEILEVSDSYFDKIIDNDYINKLINNQNNIDNLDAVSGATISSNALKKMFINTINDYEENYEK